MVNSLAYIAITVEDYEKSLNFYKNVIGLSYRGSVVKQGETTDLLYRQKGCVIQVGFLCIDDDPNRHPCLELVEYRNPRIKPVEDQEIADIEVLKISFQTSYFDQFRKSIEDMGITYELAEEYYDSRVKNYTHSKAIYLRDPDNNLIEVIASVDR